VTAAGFAAAWHNTNQDLEAANRIILEEANFSQGLRKTITELNAQINATNQGVIVGYAFVDTYKIGALEDMDRPAVGFKVRLHRITERTPATTKTTVVAETTVNSRGEYRFSVGPGEYFVEPILVIPGYPAWSSAIWLKSSGNLNVESKETVIGPIFLIRQNGEKG